MASLETLGLDKGGKIEALVYFSIEVSVFGKGAGYTAKVEVGPEESMDVLETRVSFYRLFSSRGFQLESPENELNKVFQREDLESTLFRDSQLKNGSKLVLKEPAKVKRGPDGEPIESEEEEDGEEGEDEMMEEGGEDEMIEIIGEEGEAEMEEEAADKEGDGEDAADGDGEKAEGDGEAAGADEEEKEGEAGDE